MTARCFFAVALLVGLAAAAASADEVPARIFHIGIVIGGQRSWPEHVAFEERLRELGYIEGRNLTIDFVRDDDLDRLVAAVDEFARRGVDVIVTGGQDAVLKAAITATANRSTPVVFRAVDFDPLAKGYIAGLAHPGANLTGDRSRPPRPTLYRAAMKAMRHLYRQEFLQPLLVALFPVSGRQRRVPRYPLRRPDDRPFPHLPYR